MFDITGRVALITGAGRNVGAGIARALASCGAAVAVNDLVSERAESVAQELGAAGTRAIAVPADVTDDDAVREMVQRVARELGSVDILVNNAGVATAVPATRETPEEFRNVLDVNLFGTYWMAQAAARVMKPGSAIVNLSSVLGFTTGGLPQAAYTSSKTAIIGLTRDLAQQWTGRKGIRVNALAPGWFPTEMTDAHQPGYLERVAERAPAGRLGEVEECAAALVFLASPAASYVTGTTLVVDGGVLTT